MFFQPKNVSFVFYLSLSISVAFFLVELRWPAGNFLFFSVFLLLYIPNLWTWQLIQAKYFRQHGYRNNFRFPFSSFLTHKLSLLYKTPVAMPFPAKMTLSSIWVAMPADWVILHCGAVVRTDGRSGVGRSMYGHVITKFSWMLRYYQNNPKQKP